MADHHPCAFQKSDLGRIVRQNHVVRAAEITRFQIVSCGNRGLQILALPHGIQQFLKKPLRSHPVFKANKAAKRTVNQRPAIQFFPRKIVVFSFSIDRGPYVKSSFHWSGAAKIETLWEEDQFEKRKTRPGQRIKIDVAHRIPAGNREFLEIKSRVRKTRDSLYYLAPELQFLPLPQNL